MAPILHLFSRSSSTTSSSSSILYFGSLHRRCYAQLAALILGSKINVRVTFNRLAAQQLQTQHMAKSSRSTTTGFAASSSSSISISFFCPLFFFFFFSPSPTFIRVGVTLNRTRNRRAEIADLPASRRQTRAARFYVSQQC